MSSPQFLLWSYKPQAASRWSQSLHPHEGQITGRQCAPRKREQSNSMDLSCREAQKGTTYELGVPELGIKLILTLLLAD